MRNFDYLHIESAYTKINHQIIKTPLIQNEYINHVTKSKVFFKLENLQITGSFKIRGALNKIHSLNSHDRKKGVVAYSSGNHAQAVSYASLLHNINSIIIMPKTTPQIKIQNTKKYGAQLILYDPEKESREEIGLKIARDQGRILIKPYDDFDVIAGQGTSGKEIYDQLRSDNIIPDIFLCCCGGGGLIAGSSTYLIQKFPKIKCYSIEPEEFNDTEISLEKKIIVSNSKKSYSICDALLAPQPGEITFEINKKNLTSGFSVKDEEVKKTIINLAEHLKIIAEPGGAVAASALLNNKIEVENKTVIVIISGGNIDNNLFSKIIRTL